MFHDLLIQVKMEVGSALAKRTGFEPKKCLKVKYTPQNTRSRNESIKIGKKLKLL